MDNVSFEFRGVQFTARGNFPARVPGRTSGPPEDCYEEEGGPEEADLDAFYIGDQDVTLFLADVLPDKELDKLWEATLDAAYKERG